MTTLTREFYRLADGTARTEEWWQLEFDAADNSLGVVTSRHDVAAGNHTGRFESTTHEYQHLEEFFADNHPEAAKDALRRLLTEFMTAT